MQDQVAVVTGAGQGIGKSIALALAREGASVVVVDYNITTAKEVEDEICGAGGSAISMMCDISNTSQIQDVVDNTRLTFGKIDILINNAGITRDKLSIRMTDDDWEKVIATNLTGTFKFSRAVAECMIKAHDGGSIVNIASVMGIVGNPGQANYSSSKAGVIGLTKTMAKELGSRNIRVNAIAPGYIATAMTESLPEAKREEIEKMIPLGRHGLADEVAKVAVFLCSDAASYITGEVIKVDGGLAM